MEAAAASPAWKGTEVTQQDPEFPGYQQPPQASHQTPAGEPVAQPTEGQLAGPLPRASESATAPACASTRSPRRSSRPSRCSGRRSASVNG
jgi:hypothetical protein